MPLSLIYDVPCGVLDDNNTVFYWLDDRPMYWVKYLSLIIYTDCVVDVSVDVFRSDGFRNYLLTLASYEGEGKAYEHHTK